MKYIMVISLDLKGFEDLSEVLTKIDPPHLPGFAGKVRVAIDPVATQVEDWLDDDSGVKRLGE